MSLPDLTAPDSGLTVFLNGAFECDTTGTAPEECARQIKEFLPGRPTPTAFERLRPVYGTGLGDGAEQGGTAAREAARVASRGRL
ncbi:hypothetical protein ACGFOU_11420 [Streptomyces sp. NPDC048595]|uniref:hypothetical protein n=1 Tax=Streptomyces sp. NPDC048595 TaxID=3365576 RepID=UPI003718489E